MPVPKDLVNLKVDLVVLVVNRHHLMELLALAADLVVVLVEEAMAVDLAMTMENLM